MVFQIPRANVKHYVKNAPPNIVFGFCLLTIGFAALFYGLYLKANEYIVNEDALINWRTILDFMDGEKLCIKSINNPPEQNVIETNEFDYVSINYEATFESLQQFENISNIQGSISFNGFKNVCPNDFKTPAYLDVAFNIGPMINRSNQISLTNVCVTIKGPASFLPEFVRAPCMSSINHKNKWGNIENTQKIAVLNASFCRDGQMGVLHFDKNQNNPKLFHEFLSVYDKNVIVIRLMWFGFIFTFIGILTFFYGVFFTSD